MKDCGIPPKSDKPQNEREFPWQPSTVAWQLQSPKIPAGRLPARGFPTACVWPLVLNLLGYLSWLIHPHPLHRT